MWRTLKYVFIGLAVVGGAYYILGRPEVSRVFGKTFSLRAISSNLPSSSALNKSLNDAYIKAQRAGQKFIGVKAEHVEKQIATAQISAQQEASSLVNDAYHYVSSLVSPTSTPGNGAQDTTVVICSYHRHIDDVRYIIKKPAGEEKVSYTVSWGDKGNVSGSLTNQKSEAIIEHHYATPGTYTIIFEVSSENGISSYTKTVCVQ